MTRQQERARLRAVVWAEHQVAPDTRHRTPRNRRGRRWAALRGAAAVAWIDYKRMRRGCGSESITNKSRRYLASAGLIELPKGVEVTPVAIEQAVASWERDAALASTLAGGLAPLAIAWEEFKLAVVDSLPTWIGRPFAWLAEVMEEAIWIDQEDEEPAWLMEPLQYVVIGGAVLFALAGFLIATL